MNDGYELLAELLFFFYTAALLFLFLYGVMQVHLVYKYLQYKNSRVKEDCPPLTHFPMITVQLPVYNESLVVERLIDAVAKLDYPNDRLEIQVLDDSTDETTAIVAAKVAQYQQAGLQMAHLRRTNRTGFKAGALQEGLRTAKGEFIAIFDADFVPPAAFLRCTLPHFAHGHIGMVQTRWEHLNKNSSLLTHFQAFLLDAHFSIEQMGRNNAGYFINFSGTGGVWRKACMVDAGGWHTDTLTEDFDLSYRAQLKGWKFKYLEEVSVPAELPPVISALKAQQYRWIKGNAETARKHVKFVMQSNIPVKTKVNAFFHLMVGAVFVSVFVASFLSIPLLLLKPHVPQLGPWFRYASLSLLSLLFLSVFHYVSTVHSGFDKQGARYFFKTFPLYLSFSMGISLNNALAVAEGWIGKKTAFERTPKFNVADGSSRKGMAAIQKKKNQLLPFEMLLVLYFLSGAGLAFYYQDFTMFPYHLMLAFGFGMMCYFSFREKHMLRQI